MCVPYVCVSLFFLPCISVWHGQVNLSPTGRVGSVPKMETFDGRQTRKYKVIEINHSVLGKVGYIDTMLVLFHFAANGCLISQLVNILATWGIGSSRSRALELGNGRS